MRRTLRCSSRSLPLAALIGLAGLLLPTNLTVHAADSVPGQQSCTCPDAQSNPQRQPRPKFAEARAALDITDELAALQAIQIGLTEIGDATTFAWHRNHGRLRGTVRPTSSFVDSQGRVCRHIVVTLASGRYARTAEGIACRLGDGSWTLEG